ncbi:dynein light chain roadblock-type [Cryptococcus neoformans C23]|uniref:Dynein light chain roadblock-type n=2 Tax=Cryptococcus neoformans TaxID=5207 RepID=J9VP86_CRYN9|nr:dynein light chain roadblock-type [Cryptococcus neoformans var. grubii H99]XP_012050658.1 dynein light chain roadblock-type, variant 1 [Cryptococcus neoformans var. grubii H99]XP_012050659.1 dynein light chain roadblock-type, variant 2 [Cryptococcus neoformans var. grubii H99]AUB26204.1 dynein light chain roadblock-type [Cryptococcus neoformans var. grubii]OWZ30718.1 dynein light chain roadblock-type [Cryptococcus neoformans var. grubii AD2-60a]OWZ38576.1 dynein light chain roadblock-type [|eukprot:XP_012050657.1 dynein light chain roadblock-type [Cryptococcus neoformans var. grubii H99]
MEQLASHPNVVGIIILSRTDNAIIKANGNIFDGEGGKRYAAAVESIVKGVAGALGTCNDGENDELRFMRIRTTKHELIIAPDEKYILVVLQDP